MTYRVTFDEGAAPATLHLGDEPWWALAGERYAIRRTVSEMVNWGPEAEYEVQRPDGGTAWGMCSNHNGCGVRAPGGDWGFERIDDVTTRLGDAINLQIDRAAQRVTVTPAVEAALVPHVICGLCILLDGS